MERSFGSVTVRAEVDNTELATVRTCSDVQARYSGLSEELQEHAYALSVNGANKVLGDTLVGVGSTATVSIDVQAVARPAMLVGAAAVILVHNHPSGDPSPSVDDVQVTEAVRDGLNLLRIDLLDHVIVGRDRCHSMRGNDDVSFNGCGL